MIPTAFEYRRAKSVDEALDALAARDGTKVIAGGHSLIPLLRFRLAEAPRLVDIGRLEALKGVRRSGDAVQIGAASTYRAVLDSEILRQSHPLVVEATEGIGDLQVRNCGTIGGGLAHADPASDMPAVMLALDARFTLRSRKGERTVAAREFFHGPFTTAMKDDELLTGITLSPLPDGAGTAYVCFEQAASGYALVGAAAVVRRDKHKIAEAVLAFTGLADTPFLAAAASKLAGTKGETADLETVATACVEGVEANDDIHASAAYRTHLGRVAARRALSRAFQRARS